MTDQTENPSIQFEQIHLNPSDLPWPPSWQVTWEGTQNVSVNQISESIGQLVSDDDYYWVLHQGPTQPGSQRQVLLNLDSDMALASALHQILSRQDAPEKVMFQRLPKQQAVGMAFTQHPLRPDLSLQVIEGSIGQQPDSQRLILHEQGEVAHASDDTESGLIHCIGLHPLQTLLRQLSAAFDEPRAGEWVWDGERIWLIQSVSIGTLPMPKEAWCRNGQGSLDAQVISPLWYTLMGRWLKTAFWRPLGERLGWKELDNVEPYRRIHSALYLNGAFIHALKKAGLDYPNLDTLLPPAWRRASESINNGHPPLLPWWQGLHDAMMTIYVRWQFKQVEARYALLKDDDDPDRFWLLLMALDKLGEKLMALEGRAVYLSGQGKSIEGLSFDELAAGADPVWPRFAEQPQDLQALMSNGADNSYDQLSSSTLDIDQVNATPSLAALRLRLGGLFRRLLKRMAVKLVNNQVLSHPDDIFFVYFDELWQCWHGQASDKLKVSLGERKVRYLSDAHTSQPEWIIDQVGYGASDLGNIRHEQVQGYCCVPGVVGGRVQRIMSGWQLNLVEDGDVLIMEHCEAGWLPWLTKASAIVLTHRNPDDVAVIFARQHNVPTVWGMTDAIHSLLDGSEIEVNADLGQVNVVKLVDAQPAGES